MTSGARLSVFYAACFLWSGATLVFWPLFLEHRGLEKSEVGTVLGVAIWLRALLSPIFAAWADKHDARRTALRVLSGLAMVCSFGFLWVHGFWQILLAWIAFSVCAAQLSPLCDSIALLLHKRGEMQYGRMRMWGSASFLLMTLASGWVLEGHDVENVVWLVLFGTTVGAVAAISLPDVRAGAPAGSSTGGHPLFVDVVRIRHFVPLLLAVGFLQCSHATYYAYGTIHWQSAGFGRETIGILWATGVLAEIVLFRHGDEVKQVIGLHGLLACAVVGGAVRWVCLPWCGNAGLLGPLQLLHAASFGATQICTIGIFQRIVPPHLVSTAQSLYVAVPFGLMMGSAMQLSGWLYERNPSSAFLAMAGLAALGSIGLPRLLEMRRAGQLVPEQR